MWDGEVLQPVLYGVGRYPRRVSFHCIFELTHAKCYVTKPKSGPRELAFTFGKSKGTPRDSFI